MVSHVNLLKWLSISLLVVIADQITKSVAVSNLVLFQPVNVFSGFNFTLMYNEGAAFSFLSDASGWQRWFFTVIAIVVSVAIVFWLKSLPSGQRVTAIALTLILGGAIGNVWDRVMLGHVVDFIDIYYADYHWPAFNIADSAITVGAVLLVIDSLRHAKQDKDESLNDSEDAVKK
jgi:signal peptidase II